MEEGSIEANLYLVMFEKEIYIALCEVEIHYFVESNFDSTIP